MNVLSLSYGKDSLACLGACEQLGIPIDKIVHAEVWATDDIPADLPPMVEFKKKADEIIKKRWGLDVEHVCATVSANRKYGVLTHTHTHRLSYERVFYSRRTRGKFEGRITGFPMQRASWCKHLKYGEEDIRVRLLSDDKEGGECKEGTDTGMAHDRTSVVQFGAEDGSVKKSKVSSEDMSILGIAADETERIERHLKDPKKMLPLVQIGWTEADCRKWCEENDLLSPIYTTATRGGCWFCHNQGNEQLRLLRKNYPELWNIMLKWDKDSPVTFKPNGCMVRDYEERFRMEDEGIDMTNFRWEWVKSGIGGQYSFW